MFWKRKKPAFTREESLACVALANQAVRVARDQAGRATLFVPLLRPPWLLRALRVSPPSDAERKIELDEIGSFVWGMCDGKRTVRQMIAALAERYKLNPKEAEVSLTTFLRSLVRKNLIVLILPKRPVEP